MKLPMKLPLKISRTKKRLSNERWYLSVIVLALIGLILILNFGMQLVSLSPKYGVIPLELPVMASAPDDPSAHKYKEAPRASLAPTTAAIILRANGDFFVGDLQAFTSQLNEVRNKFLVPQVNGEPQITALLDTVRQWQFHRKETRAIKNDNIVVFVPASTVPVTVVMQVVSDLKNSPYFKDVILANGLM
jgi:hypothetical protein